jgi:Domain of unknown function (DUF4350)
VIKDYGIRILLVVLLVGCVWWVTSCTEWVEVEVATPAKGEAAKNDLYATQQLARRLGADVTVSGGLQTLPPKQATLLLTSGHWDLFPERVEQLQRWVEQGGHLVIPMWQLTNKNLTGWLPIKRVEPNPSKSTTTDEDDDSRDAEGDDAAEPFWPSGPSRPSCDEATEPDNVAPAYPDGLRQFEICLAGGPDHQLVSTQPSQWQLNGPYDRVLLLRIFHGAGRVTVVRNSALFRNDHVTRGDNALVIAAALQLRHGAPVWFVTEEDRPPLLSWLWAQAWPAFLLAGLAIALALWRGGVRFGPLAANATVNRRSMIEQITGTAQFLRRHGGATLYAAQLRALHAAAANHVQHYGQMDRASRAQAIARETGLSAESLGSALDTSIPRRRTDWAPVLELLETARRLLVQSLRHR